MDKKAWEVKIATYFLGISTISHRLIVIVFQYNVAELTVWNIFDNVPLHWELSTPFVLLPVINALLKINRSNHLRYTTELGTRIYLKLQTRKQSAERIRKLK